MAASAVAFTVIRLPVATVSSVTSCNDIEFIFARGSGQTLGDSDYTHFKTSINAELLRQKSNLKIGFYELGSEYQDGAKYPAVESSLLNVLGAKVSSGAAFAFGESVQQGAAELQNYTEKVSAACPNTKFVIAGYSQGAMVISKSLATLNSSKFVYAATFGDPKLYLPEGKGFIPAACLGKNLSSYRIFAPNCRTYSGSLEAKKPYVENDWSGKVGLWCKDKDLVCGAGLGFKKVKSSSNPLDFLLNSALASHTSYTSDGIYLSAAKTIVEKIRTLCPGQFGKPASTISANHDVVILLDNTSSMRTMFKYYREEALSIAKSTIDVDGRVAFYIYGDLAERHSERLLDFTNDLELFRAYLYSTGVSADGGSRHGSFYSALLDVLNNQNWRIGATKSVVVLTNSPPLIPDRDGTTPEQVRVRTLEIDPVNIYLFDPFGDQENPYEQFLTSTGGTTLTGLGSTSFISNRPSVEFPLSEYAGHPDDEFVFIANTSGEIISYAWDLDFDGQFEVETTEPVISKVYEEEASGFIQLKVTDRDGRFSTASAWVEVSSNRTVEPSLDNLKVAQKGTSVYISFELGENTIGAVVALNDNTLGITSENTLEISDINQSTTLSLTPISSDGTRGKTLSGEITYLYTPKTGYK